MANLTGCVAGKTYSFKFISDFNKINGIYTVTKIMTFDEMLDDGIDLVATLYSAVDKTDEQYQTEYVNYSNEDVFKLTSVDKTFEDQPVVYYVPVPLIAERPDARIQEYGKLGLMVDLGVFADQDQLSYLSSFILEQIQAATGIKSQVELVAYKTVWMEEAEYERLQQEREALKTGIINHFTRYKAVEAENIKLTSTVKAYEEIIKDIPRPDEP